MEITSTRHHIVFGSSSNTGNVYEVKHIEHICLAIRTNNTHNLHNHCGTCNQTALVLLVNVTATVMLVTKVFVNVQKPSQELLLFFFCLILTKLEFT